MSIMALAARPLRLTGLFLASLAIFATIAAAAVAVLYIVADQRESEVTVFSLEAGGNVTAPEGLIVLIDLASEEQFEELLGFAPFIPAAVPETTAPGARLYATQPDAQGLRSGYIQFAASGGASSQGVAGPTIRLIETRASVDAEHAGELRGLTSDGQRTIISDVACGDLALRIELFFNVDAGADEQGAGSYMRAVAASFVERVQAQCAL